MSMKVQVGLIGLGAMGLGMAQSLRRAGHTVHVFDVRLEAALAFAKDGGVVAASPAALGAASDVDDINRQTLWCKYYFGRFVHHLFSLLDM